MIVEIAEQEFVLLYSRARASYARCISDPENNYLQEEVDIALEAIDVHDISVQVKFYQSDVADYLTEVELGLYAHGSYMGKYTYSEDTKGAEGENGLVFY